MLCIIVLKEFYKLKQKKEIFNNLLEVLKNHNSEISDYEIEKSAEIMMCTNTLHNLEDVLNWYEKVKNNLNAKEELIDLDKVLDWENKNSLIKHKSGGYFEVVGVRVKSNGARELKNSGWDQPMLRESNKQNTGGLLGLIRTKIDGLPHYLVEAKYEPGNYNSVLLSPTLQATFSNLNQVHNGRKPNYFEFFLDHEDSSQYLFNNMLTEDGGRLYKKTNKGLVKELNFSEIEIKDNFILLSLFQIKQLIKTTTIVNPHLARLIFI